MAMDFLIRIKFAFFTPAFRKFQKENSPEMRKKNQTKKNYI